MEYVNAVLVTLGLCTDVVIASISKGLCIRKLTWGKLLAVSGLFALVQGGCTLISYQLKEETADIIKHLDHWAAFVILTIIGALMLIRSYHDAEMDQVERKLKYVVILLIAIAVSLDTLPVITTETFRRLSEWPGTALITGETLVISMLGIWIGHKLGAKYRYKSEFAGGILLLILALKILVIGMFKL